MLTLFTMGWNQFRSKFWSKFWSKNISYFCLLIFCFNIALLITQTVSVWVLQFVGNRMQINFQKCACRCFWVLNSTVWVIPMNKCFKIFSSHKQKKIMLLLNHCQPSVPFLHVLKAISEFVLHLLQLAA